MYECAGGVFACDWGVTGDVTGDVGVEMSDWG